MKRDIKDSRAAHMWTIMTQTVFGIFIHKNIITTLVFRLLLEWIENFNEFKDFDKNVHYNVWKTLNLLKKPFLKISFRYLQQTATYIENHMLPQTEILSDGSRDRICTRNQRNEVGTNTNNRHLCDVTTLPEHALQAHICGNKNNLMLDNVPDAAQFRAPLKSGVKRKFCKTIH